MSALTGLFDDAPIGVFILDGDGVIVYVNRRQCEQSALEAADFLGKNHRSLAYAALERAGLLPEYDRLLQEGVAFERTLPRYRRLVDGAVVSLTMRGFRHQGRTLLLTSVDTVLAAQLDRYEQLFENANDGIFIVSREGKFLAANRKFCEIAGYPRERIVGQTAEMFRPGRMAETLERTDRILREGHLGPYELEIATPAGRKVVSLNAFALLEGGRPAAVMNIARDVTAEHRQRAEREALVQALRESEEKFRRMIEGNPDPVALTDFTTGKMLELNDAWCAYSGLERAQLLGAEGRVPQLWPDRAERERFIELVRRDGLARDFEARMRVRGQDRIAEISGTLVEWGGRQTVATWLRDVTESRRLQAAVRESEERFRRIAAASAVGIFRADETGRCTYTNPRWQEMSGLTLEQSLGDGWISAVHPQDRGRLLPDWQALVAGGGSYDAEFRFQTPQGTVCWAQGHVRPVRSETGKVLAFVGTADDITERKAAERMRRDLVRMLSHDIKNPLAVIRGFVGLAREEAGGGGEIASFLDGIDGAAERAMALALNFLDAERIETGGLRLHRAAASLNAIVEAALRDQAALARLRHVTLRANLDEDLPSLSIDGPLIERTLTNLLANALEFSPEGAAVVVATHGAERTVSFSVSDGGPGVAAEILPKLFQRYSGGDRSRPGSTGLGLFIVRTIVEAHGGSVAVERSPQGGACFTVSLPRQDPAPQPGEAAELPGNPKD